MVVSSLSVLLELLELLSSSLLRLALDEELELVLLLEVELEFVPVPVVVVPVLDVEAVVERLVVEAAAVLVEPVGLLVVPGVEDCRTVVVVVFTGIGV